MILERVEHRILGALRCVDGVTGVPLSNSLDVQGEGLRLIRNRRGFYVISEAQGYEPLQAYSGSFTEPPLTPPLGQIWPVAVELQIQDPTGRYLPRRVSLQLPRNASVPHTAAESVFRAVDVPLYPSPSAPSTASWAVIRATVLENAEAGGDRPNRLPWALIRVVREGNGAASFLTTPAINQADWRGEALVAVAGIPVTTWDGSTALAVEVNVRLEVVFDPSLSTLPDLNDWATVSDPNAGYLPDPAFLNSNDTRLREGQITPYRLASGRDRPDRLQVTLTARN